MPHVPRSLRHPRHLIALAALLLPLAAAPPLAAELFVPSTTADTFDGECDSECSLREAIAGANARRGSDVIVLGPGVYRLTRAGAGEDGGATGDLDVTDDLDIVGANPAATVLDGGGLDRVLELHGDRLDLQGVTVRNGTVEGEGGGLRNRFGQLTLGDVVVDGNTAVEGDGGGIWSYGTLTLERVTLAGNTAGGHGGGIAARLALAAANVTVSGNQAGGDGGGLYLFMPLLGTAVNATVTANSAGGRGGGVVSEAPISAASGMSFGSSILAGNSASTDRDCAGAALSGGFNLLGVGAGCAAFGAGKGDQVGTLGAPLDPMLEPLAAAGGTTPTHPLRAGSPAIDAGAPAPGVAGEAAVDGLGCDVVDQRGAARPGSGSARCDAGAFERTAACVAAADALCLGGGRFRVRATSKLPQQAARAAGAVALTGDSGSFWFFDAANLEMTVKVLDACLLGGHFWVFLSGLTDVELEVTVEDTAAGGTRSYANPRGRPFAPVLDTQAFPNCSIASGASS